MNVCHVELPVSNLEKAEKFYSNLFGWKFDKLFPKYSLVNRSNNVSIGIPERDDFSPTKTGLYFQVEDITKSLSKVKELGGEIELEKSQISEEIGFQGKFKDIFGNTIGIFAPK